VVPLSLSFFQDIQSDYLLTHRMAHEMPEYLVPPPRTAILARAHTEPDAYEPRPQQTTVTDTRIPASPPPAYTDVVKEVGESNWCDSETV
jgi:hypothetical protein